MASEPEEQLSRKAFFKEGFMHMAKSVYSAVEKKVEKSVKRIVIRPPFAVSEVAFIALCTGGCDKCVKACPHDAIALWEKPGSVTGIKTPRIAPDKAPCYICEDFPCVEACPTGALQREEDDPLKMGNVLLRLGCHKKEMKDPFCDYCVDRCPVPGAIHMDDVKGPIVNHKKCVGCGVCEYACPARPSAIKIIPLDVVVVKEKPKEGSRAGKSA